MLLDIFKSSYIRLRHLVLTLSEYSAAEILSIMVDAVPQIAENYDYHVTKFSGLIGDHLIGPAPTSLLWD